MVSATPARTVGLDDRGRIATGLRADLVRVHRPEGVPVARAVWREGRRVA
jgi:alpha-D-ribose 1-methylphosphonate 5-triphosphate diphosphatase